MEHKKIIKIFFIIYILLILITSSYLFRYSWQPNDSYQNIFWSENIASGNSLRYEVGVNDKIDQNIFGFRGGSILNGKISPTLQIGLPLITGISQSVIGYFPYFIIPLFSFLAIFYLFKLAKLFMKEKFAYIISALFSLHYILIFNSVFVMNNIPSTSIFIIASYYFFSYIKNSNIYNLILFILFFSINFWIRTSDLIPYIIFIPFIPKIIKKIKLLKLLPIVLIPLLSLLSFLNFQKNMFGSPFSFLSLNTLRDYSLSQDISSQGILFFDSFNLLITNIKEQIFPITGIFFLIYLIVLFYSIKNKEYNIIPLLSIPIIQLFFYFGGIWGGYGQELVSYSAYQRYFLISYSILFLSFGIFLNNIRFKKQLVSILTFLAITFLVISFPFLINDINRFDDTIEKTIDYKKQLITNTEKNAIIFTKIQDKNIFPERTPAIYQSIPPEHRIEETTEIIEKLLLNGYHVYFLKEDNVRMSDMEFLFEEYKKDLEKNNFRLINKFNNFYEITKNEN